MDTDDSASRDMVVLLTGYLSYRALRARRDELGLPLKADEAARLAELEWVFGGGESSARPLFLPRFPEQLRLQLPITLRDAEGELHDGLLADLTTAGFFVSTAHAYHAGERVIVKFFDEEAGREWQFAGEVGRVRMRGDGVWVRFTGIPLEVCVAHSRLAEPSHPTRPTEHDPLPVAA